MVVFPHDFFFNFVAFSEYLVFRKLKQKLNIELSYSETIHFLAFYIWTLKISVYLAALCRRKAMAVILTKLWLAQEFRLASIFWALIFTRANHGILDNHVMPEMIKWVFWSKIFCIYYAGVASWKNQIKFR